MTIKLVMRHFCTLSPNVRPSRKQESAELTDEVIYSTVLKIAMQVLCCLLKIMTMWLAYYNENLYLNGVIIITSKNSCKMPKMVR